MLFRVVSSPETGDRPPRRRLDAALGRSASADQLRRHLATAPAAYLKGALDNPALNGEEVLLLLRNRNAPEPVLQRIGSDSRWRRTREIRRALVQHPKTPLGISRRLLADLPWPALAEAGENTRLNAPLRRMAQQTLATRLEKLALGERVALARRATRILIDNLKESAEDRVLRSLLGNALLVELDAVGLASAETAPLAFLAHLAGHHRWGQSREVRLALLHNPRTPIPTALGLLHKLDPEDLQRLRGDGKVPRIIRVGAERELSGDTMDDPLPHGTDQDPV